MKLRSLDYRHYICVGITLVSLACGFLFPNALPRIGESFRDLAFSAVYYFTELFELDPLLYPTVSAMPSWQWAESPWDKLTLFPYEWEEFKLLWNKYWTLWASKDNFINFWYSFGDTASTVARLSLVFFPLVPIIIAKFAKYTSPVAMPKKKQKSKQLLKFEQFLFKVVYPVIAWVKDFVSFVAVNERYWQTWLVIWLLHFNVISIVIEFLAFYLYLVVSADFIGIYTQVLKLIDDLTPMIRFIPGLMWLCVGVWVYNYLCRSMAFTRLYAYERANKAFLNKRGVVTTVYGPMGTGKTQMITSMSLSSEVKQWDDAFEVLLECDLRFPNFPWQRLRDYLNRAVSDRELCDLDAVRAKMQTFRRAFDYAISKGFTPGEWQQYRKEKKLRMDYTFGYDYEHYRYTYNDGLKIEHLYDVLSDYACAYLIYTVKTSLIFANYSIRVSSLIRDIGNMPLRNTDFFSENPESYSALRRQCHIINYDMLRLGKRMQKEFKLSFGVYVITEIDKERKNSLELNETKKNTEECNQKNDLFNACLMMCRHAAVVRNRVFIRIIADLQRPEAWGAGGRELGEVIYIAEKGEEYPTLPFFSPYWLLQGLYSFLQSKWGVFRSEYDHQRRDGTLFSYLVDNTVSGINHHYDKVHGQFNTFALKLEIQSGRMDGQVTKDRWHIIYKKDRSDRYKTDCLSSVFSTYEPNTMHIDDFICYSGKFGTLRENGLQNSYFQNDIQKCTKMRRKQ